MGRKKGYIIGSKVAPNNDDRTYDKWEVKDALVKSWLINSMIDKLMSQFIYCRITKEMWDAMRKSYLNVSDFL